MAGDRGRLTATVDGARLIFDVQDDAGGGGWAFSSSLGTVLAWFAIPPLVLWLVWLSSRPRHRALAAAVPRELPARNDVASRSVGPTLTNLTTILERPR